MNGKGVSGMTLVELLVASAISVAIAGLLGTAFYQFFVVTSQGSNAVSALHQVQNAGHWIARDGQMASSAVGGDSLELVIPNSATVTYALVETNLIRTADGVEKRIARYVTALDFDVDGRIVTMSITVAPEGAPDITERAMYKVLLRPVEGGG